MEQVGVQAGRGLQFWEVIEKNKQSQVVPHHHHELLLLPHELQMLSPARAVCGLGSVCSVPGHLQWMVL